MTSSIIRFGLLFGIALWIGFFVSHAIFGDSPENYNSSEIVGYSVMIVSAIAVIYGIKDYKQNQNGGQLSFFSGFGVGAAISAIAGLMFGAYILLYLKFINPEFTQTYMAYYEQQIKNSGATEEVMQQQLAELASYSDMMSNDFAQAAVMFVTVLMIGLLFSLVAAFAMRTSANHSQTA